jgi:hypothetical protein
MQTATRLTTKNVKSPLTGNTLGQALPLPKSAVFAVGAFRQPRMTALLSPAIEFARTGTVLPVHWLGAVRKQ